MIPHDMDALDGLGDLREYTALSVLALPPMSVVFAINSPLFEFSLVENLPDSLEKLDLQGVVGGEGVSDTFMEELTRLAELWGKDEKRARTIFIEDAAFLDNYDHSRLFKLQKAFEASGATLVLAHRVPRM